VRKLTFFGGCGDPLKEANPHSRVRSPSVRRRTEPVEVGEAEDLGRDRVR
jgi:hypothetical protein